MSKSILGFEGRCILCFMMSRPKLTSDGMLTVKIRPNALQTCWSKPLSNGTQKVDVAAPPEDEKANKELIRFLAKEYGVPRSSVHLCSGQHARTKVMKICS